MIIDTMDNSNRYEALHPLFPKAFQRLKELIAQSDLPAGRVELDGATMFAMNVDGVGCPTDEAKLEAHRAYIDIQYTAAGSDHIGWSHLSAINGNEGYDQEGDVEFFSDTPQCWINVPVGHYAIFFPEDAHAPMANTGQPTRKIIIKIAV